MNLSGFETITDAVCVFDKCFFLVGRNRLEIGEVLFVQSCINLSRGIERCRSGLIYLMTAA